MSIALGIKDARLRIRGDKEHPLGLCLNCSKPTTAKEINSCGEPACNKECKKVFYWVRKVIRSLDSSVTNGYVNYQWGQGGV